MGYKEEVKKDAQILASKFKQRPHSRGNPKGSSGSGMSLVVDVFYIPLVVLSGELAL